MPLNVKKGFCGTSLYSSSLFLAWIQMFFTCVVLLISMVLLGVALSGWKIPWFFIEIEKANEDTETTDNPKNMEDKYLSATILVASLLLVSSLISFLVVLGLLLGIYKKNHCIMTAYLIVTGTGCTFNLLKCLGLFFGLFSGTLQAFILLIEHVAVTVLNCYCWLIIYSYYGEIKAANRRTSISFPNP